MQHKPTVALASTAFAQPFLVTCTEYTPGALTAIVAVPWPETIPGPLQRNVSVPPAGNTFAVNCKLGVAHARSLVIVTVGSGLTVTVFSQSVATKQPSLEAWSLTVNEPDAPAVTDTDPSVVDPLIVPFPVIDQECVTVPPAGRTVEV